jgi:hypothetical protein
MNMLAKAVALSVAAGAGLLFRSSVNAHEVRSRMSRPPLTAIYRSSATPELESDAQDWIFVRSGAAAFAGVDVEQPRESAAHQELMELLARQCCRGSATSGITTHAFEREFELHRQLEPAPPGGIREVWWNRDLELPLVIVREQAGRTITDELVHLQLEERSEVLASKR